MSVNYLLSEFPTRTERFVIEAKDWLARLGIRTGSSSQMAKELESRSDVPLPELLACIVTAEESSLRHLPAQPIASLDELEEGAEEARYAMQAWDEPDHGLLPFAKDETGEYWYFTHHEAPAGEVRVLQLDGEDRGHTFSQWLAGALFIGAIRRALGDHVLIAAEAERALQRLIELEAPWSSRVLPF